MSVFGVVSRCRYEETCSVYMQRQVQRHGTIAGVRKGVLRILSCHSIHQHPSR